MLLRLLAKNLRKNRGQGDYAVILNYFAAALEDTAKELEATKPGAS